MSTDGPRPEHPRPEDPRPADVPPAATGGDATPERTTAPRRASGFDADGHVKGSRSGALYFGLVVAALLTILVLVFILQNSDSATIRFLGFEGAFPIGVAMLLAAVTGILIVAVPGSVRILQLRRSLAKNEKRNRAAE
ncbi:lipopolysaccharide assembly protein LapA domain-containing protein [Aeromicrobium halocynthiae]|uniref:Lipopolysaccharide assembly protein LapA domain-containing protein n=1 Tax=Aeromicrobium halocynthiae TaxID=560557 RepID=A0ABN2W200_9ACTN